MNLKSFFLLFYFNYITNILCKDYIAIGLTTIPPRYLTVRHVINSWLKQEIKPSLIVLFIPEFYHNFIGESRHDKTKTLQILINSLNEHFPNEIKNGLIKIQKMKYDWGPITKYVGLFEHYESLKQLNDGNQINYWIIGDDDVKYSSNTITEYINYLNNNNNNKILTHFKIHSRITTKINNLPIPIKHLQGVDTILFPTTILSSTPFLSFPIVTTLITFFHKKCPNSFYQDDYIISLILSLSQYDNIESIWSGIKVANHVNGVSRSNQQMHIHPDVFQREEDTKKCIIDHSNEIYQIIQQKLNINEL